MPLSRRQLYRATKRRLTRMIRRYWRGTQPAFERALRQLLRGRSCHELTLLARRPALAALLLATALLSGASAADSIDLGDIAANGNTGGFAIYGDAGNRLGGSVSGAGDVNGDGLADVVVGVTNSDTGPSVPGGAYVVFGRDNGAIVQLSSIASGSGGGFAMFPETGLSGAVSAAGDVNGDGFGDLVVLASGFDPDGHNTGNAYVVFGKADSAPVQLGLIAEDDNDGGFALFSQHAGHNSPGSASCAGDVNGDGLDDIILGAPNDYPNGRSSGTAYILFGKADGTSLYLRDFAGSAHPGGFALYGEGEYDFAGSSVSGAGDVNGDGFDDVIVGAKNAALLGRPLYNRYGLAYVVFGKTDGISLELSDVRSNLNPAGYLLYPAQAFEGTGHSVAGAGDVNGDGLADVIVGAPEAPESSSFPRGQSYVVFGKAGGAAVNMGDLEDPDNSAGFAIYGAQGNDRAGTSLSGGGDVNGDGFADLIVGAPWDTADSPGTAYVVFGKADGGGVQLLNVETSDTGGFALFGDAVGDLAGFRVSHADDVNGDGMPDALIGAWGADPTGLLSGASYVVFSPTEPQPSSTYFARSAPGDGPGGAIVPKTSLENARFTLDFSDDDFGSDAVGGASLESVVLHRSGSPIANLLPLRAGVAWQFSTDRIGWNGAQVTVKFTDAEAASIVDDGALPALFTAPDPAGPWTKASSVADLNRNELTAAIGPAHNDHYFAIGLGDDQLWVNFGYNDVEWGTRSHPFDTLQEAVAEVADGGTIHLDAVSPVSSSTETITIQKPVTLHAVGGPVRIGGT